MIAFNLEIFAEYSYLQLPIQIGSEKIAMQITCEGKVVREFEAELSVLGKRNWWAHCDISEFRGKTIILRTIGEKLTEAQVSLLTQMITQSDGLLNAQDLYNERHRPQFHFTPKRGWNNDPNGLIYNHGTWHLFFQHNPFSTNWGTMHWGHATSEDLLHWVEQPIALYPRSIQDAPWSGGAVRDARNTSRLQSGESEPIVLSFTSTGRGECLAYSLDEGKTFQEYTGNPVLVHHGRDPKIIWYEPQEKWVLILYEEGSGRRGYELYDSSDLIRWRRLQYLAGWFECPEIFSLPVEGSDSPEQRWVIHGCIFHEWQSAFQVGSFTGEWFFPESNPQEGHAGPHFYASQVFSHAPEDRKVMVGWLRDANYPDMPFGNGMSVPLELSLRQVSDQIRLCFYPVKEIEHLYLETVSAENLTTQQATALISESPSELLDIEFVIETGAGKPFRIGLDGYPIVYDPETETISFAGKSMPRQPGKSNIHLRLLIDRSVIELFVDHGWAAFASMTIFDDRGCMLCLEGDVQVQSLVIHTLATIWRDP